MTVTRRVGPGAEAADAFAASRGRYGCRGIKAAPGTGVSEKAAAALPEGARPPAHSDRGRHHRRPGWPEPMERFGPTGSTGAKGRSPDDAAAEGFLGGMKVESVHPGRREEYTRGEVLALIDEYIHWRNHDASSNRSVG